MRAHRHRAGDGHVPIHQYVAHRRAILVQVVGKLKMVETGLNHHRPAGQIEVTDSMDFLGLGDVVPKSAAGN
jgi:hypothetical protein